MTKSNIVKDIYLKLIDKAFTNGIISTDESQMLEKIKNELVDFDKYLTIAMEDRIITPDELETLKKIQNSIVSEAETVAKEDKIITRDEEILLETLNKLLKKSIDRHVDISQINKMYREIFKTRLFIP